MDYSSLFYGSTHELGNYPGTGRQPSLQNIDPVEMYALRQVVNDDATFDQLFDLSKDSLWNNVEHKPHYQVSRDHPIALTQRIVDRQIPSGRRSRYDFRIKWREILYEMIWFGPSLVIISAGFDAHDDDPLADLELTEEDYYWATEATLLACRCCSLVKSNAAGGSTGQTHDSSDVKCLSILEGGYHLEAISKSSIAHVDALFTSQYGYGDGSLSKADPNLPEAVVTPPSLPKSEEHQHGEGKTGGDEEEGERPKVPIEDILKGLDQSISSLLMEALMSMPDPERDTDPYEAIAEEYYGYDGEGEEDEGVDVQIGVGQEEDVNETAVGEVEENAK